MKKHKDCEWLFKTGNKTFKCCDLRGTLYGREIDKNDIERKACKYFHPQKHINKNENSVTVAKKIEIKII